MSNPRPFFAFHSRPVQLFQDPGRLVLTVSPEIPWVPTDDRSPRARWQHILLFGSQRSCRSSALLAIKSK